MGVWFRDGEVWIVGLRGTRTPLKDSKGLAHISLLLARPGEEIAALDLIGAVERHGRSGAGAVDPSLEISGGLGDAGALLDTEAKTAYRRRLEELRAEIEEAERFSDAARSERAHREMEFLARELSAAVGLGGRDRRAGSASERARVNVTRAIKATVDRIAGHDEALAAHLRATLKTGTFCSYAPYAVERVEWDFSGATAGDGAPSGGFSPASRDEPPLTAPPEAPAAPAPAAPPPPRRRTRMAHALVEREPELAEIEQALDIAAGGAGDLLVIDGPAGIGKSALLATVEHNAVERGFTVLTARGSQLERAFSFGVARQLFDAPLRRLDAGRRDALLRGAVTPAAAMLGYGDAPEGDQPGATLPILNGLYWLTVGLAADAPLLVIVDDVQWADSASAGWLTFSATRVIDAPVLFVLGARPLEPGADAELSDLLDGGDAGVIELAPLSEAAVGAVVRSRWPDAAPEFCAACHVASEGNPFYLHELIAAARAAGITADGAGAERLRDVTPESVTRLVGRRLQELPAAVRALGRACAVLGGPVELVVAAELAELDSDAALDAAEHLMDAGLLARRQPLDFAHPLIRAAVDTDVPLGARTRLHELAVKVLSARGAAVTEIAAHVLHARPNGDPETVAHLRAAARQASGHGSPQTAVALLERALAEPPAPAAVPETLLELARARYELGERRAAEAELERALPLAEDAALRAEIVLELCRDFDEMDVTARVTLLDETIAGLGDGPAELRHRLEARTLALLADAVIVSASPQVREVFEARLNRVPDVAAGDTAGERELRAIYAAHKAVNGEIAADEAHAMVTEALDNGILMRRLGAGIWNAESGPEVLAMVDAFDQADRHAREAERVARDHGVVAAEAWACMLRSIIALLRGSLLEADALLRSVFAINRQTRTPYVQDVANQVLAWVSLERGDVNSAERACGCLDPGLSPMGTPFARGRLHAATGAHDLAVPEFRSAAEALDVVGRWRGVLGSPRVDLATSLTALGQTEEAAAIARTEVQTARRFGAPSALGAALRALGQATGGEEGLRHLSEAVEVLAPSQAVLARAHSLYDLGAAQHAAGETDAARTSLRHALDLATRCAALNLRERARGELMAAGEQTAPLAPTGAALLTAAELRIAKLAAEGSPDLEIAQALFVTVPAVERSLALIAAKLGIAGRDELAAALDAEASAAA